MQYVVANKLMTSGVLTFDNARLEQLDNGSIEVLHQLGLLIRNVRRVVKEDFPFSAVPEFSEAERQHIHLMLPIDFPYAIVEEKWSKNGFAFHQIVPNMEELRVAAFYLGKDFDKPEDQRITKRRVVNAIGFRPKSMPAEIMTLAEAEELAKQQAKLRGTTVKEIKSNNPWCRGGYSWL